LREALRSAIAAGAIAAVIALASAADVYACAVCYGDPNSSMTKAMVAGVWVLLGCIAMLLMSFGGLFMYWMQRSKRLRSLDPANGGASF
jgi:hypothetical protein